MKKLLLILSLAIYTVANAQNIAASFSVTTVCYNSPVCFTDLSTSPTYSITTWNWNFGDGNTSVFENPCNTYSMSGTYTVTLIVTNSNGEKDTAANPVTVNPNPVAAFSFTDGCLNNSTVFTDGSTSATQWYWEFGDMGTSTLQNPTHTYLGWGMYLTTLIVTGGGCSDTIMDTVTVYPLPVVNFVSDTVCFGDTTSFTDLSFIPAGSISNWYWNFGDGNTSSLQNPIHLFSSAGNFIVTLTATSNYGCVSSVMLYAVVYPLPTAAFNYTQSSDTVFCNDLSVGYLPLTYNWNFGDGATSTLQDPVHIYPFGNTYNICLYVTSSFGCMDTICHTITIASVDENYLSNSISISPNPFSTFTTIDVSTSLDMTKNKIRCELFDVYGRKVKQFEVNNTTSFTISKDGLPSGVYFLRVTTPLSSGRGAGGKAKLIITD